MAIRSPKLQVSKFTNFLTSDQAITAASAIIITPAVLGFVSRLTSRSGFLVQHATVALLLSAILVFIVAGMMSGVIRSVLLGASIGIFVNAMLTVAPIAAAVNRIGAVSG